MSEEGLTPEEVLLLAQAALAPGAPVKVRSYVKHSTKGKEVVVRQAIRGATGGTGRTPINPPTAQTTPVISNKAIQSETAAARAGVAVQRAALAAAKKQAAAALKQQAAKNKQQKKTTTKKAAAPKTTQPKTPKVPHLGNLGALGALHGGHGGGLYALRALRGRRGGLFPGSKALSSAMARSRKAKEAKSKETSRASSVNRIAHPSIEPRISGAERHIANSQARLDAAHRALETAAAYRRSHGHGHHAVGAGFHEKLAGEIIKHEAKRLSSHLHMSNSYDEDIVLTQEALRIEGYPVEITGDMNDETADALAQFLAKEGIDIDANYE